MKLSRGARLIIGTLGAVVLLVGLAVWTIPEDFGEVFGAPIGNSVECQGGVCRAYEAIGPTSEDDPTEESTTLLFEGTQAEMEAWYDELNLEATRPVALGLFGVGGMLVVLALTPGRKEPNHART